MNVANSDEEEILVSIWCPVYNHDQFVSRTLDGFLMQKTDFECEIVLHDDASTDNTASVIRSYQTLYPGRIRTVLQTVNQMSQDISALTRIMLNECRGKYIAICEGDDYWTDPLKLQKQVDYLNANPGCVLSFHNIDYKYEGEIEGPFQSDICLGKIESNKFFQAHIPTLSILFRNVAQLKKLKYSENIYVDRVLLTFLLNYGDMVCLPGHMGVYRIHQMGEFSGSEIKERYYRMYLTYRYCLNYVPNDIRSRLIEKILGTPKRGFLAAIESKQFIIAFFFIGVWLKAIIDMKLLKRSS